jgi:uncharacterized protein (DUF1800 family)
VTVARAAVAILVCSSFAVADLPAQVRRRAIGGAPQTEVFRLLEQTTFGPTDALVAHVQLVGFDAFLDEQFAAPMSGYPTLPKQRSIPPDNCKDACLRDHYTLYPLQCLFYKNALYADDQLRQRVAWALHKIFPVSGNVVNEPKGMTPYLQILDRDAFGNFRQLLKELTLNATMGAFLNTTTNTKTSPNENYAREILQLFSIGTILLNPDGTPRLDAHGAPLPTYDQPVVDGFTRVFTGWTFSPPAPLEDRNDDDPLIPGKDTHDTGEKLLLNGVVLPAGQTIQKDLDDAIDNIFNHPNVGPFISQQLIQSLVTSNPSPAYVARVVAVFNDNGSGVRGDLKAVVRAIILDREARTNVGSDVVSGHLREPVLLITNILRQFNARSFDGRSNSDGNLNPFSAAMAEDVFTPLSVFSYYRPEYIAPGAGGLLGPEFGTISASTTAARANFVNTIVFDGVPTSTDSPAGTSLDLSRLQAMGDDPASLVGELNRTLMHGTMSNAMRDSIIEAVAAIPSSNARLRAQQGVYLVCTSSQYQVQR